METINYDRIVMNFGSGVYFGT